MTRQAAQVIDAGDYGEMVVVKPSIRICNATCL
jgi:hypothetical protein